jgi:hypothetical protein
MKESLFFNSWYLYVQRRKKAAYSRDGILLNWIWNPLTPMKLSLL